MSKEVEKTRMTIFFMAKLYEKHFEKRELSRRNSMGDSMFLLHRIEHLDGQFERSRSVGLTWMVVSLITLLGFGLTCFFIDSHVLYIITALLATSLLLSVWNITLLFSHRRKFWKAKVKDYKLEVSIMKSLWRQAEFEERMRGGR